MESLWENLEVPIDQLPKVEEIEYQRHPLRYKRYRYISSAIWLVPLLVAGIVLSIVFVEPLLYAATFGSLVLYAMSILSIEKGYPKRSYALREKDLTYRKGWIFHSVTTVPFNRIQHTEVSQGPLERKFQLCTLHLYTAGGSTSDLSVPGLEQEEAAQMRDFVARKSASHA